MVNKKIARAIANMAIFLEFSSEDILDEDAAVQALEQLASDLQVLDDNSRGDLSEAFRLIASDYDDKMNDFVKGLPEALGIE